MTESKKIEIDSDLVPITVILGIALVASAYFFGGLAFYKSGYKDGALKAINACQSEIDLHDVMPGMTNADCGKWPERYSCLVYSWDYARPNFNLNQVEN